MDNHYYLLVRTRHANLKRAGQAPRLFVCGCFAFYELNISLYNPMQSQLKNNSFLHVAP